MFDKFSELTLPTILALILLVVIGLVMLIAARRVKWNTRMLSFAALSIALAFILSFIRLYKMPQSGSITPASMLPIMIFSYMFGALPGILAGAVYGLLQFFQDPFFVNPIQFVLEYPMAFGLIGVAGVLREAPMPQALRLPVGAVIAGVLRLLVHTVAGAVFFYEYAGDMNPWLYSIGYNGTYLAVDTAICAVIAAIPAVQNVADPKRYARTA